MFVLAGVFGVFFAFAFLELIEFIGLGDDLLGTVPRLFAALLVGGAFGGFLVEGLSRL